MTDPILDDLFHGIIWSAFIAEARAVGGWPDPERTRRRAYAMYEAELAASRLERGRQVVDSLSRSQPTP